MNGKRIILGVTGGIAAYKAVYLLRDLQKAGAEVRVVMTPSATRFVGLETFAVLSRNAVPIEVFNENNDDIESTWSKHIHWAEWADLMIVAPCTANSLAKIVHGHSDNMLTTTVMAVRCPVLLCPTMDGGMYRSAANQRNLALARELGFHILNPESGYLASGLEDQGRLPDVHVILNTIRALLNGHDTLNAVDPYRNLLEGKKFLITAGPTREYIDAVRFISNPSSGKMGVAMAIAAFQMGATVHLIHGTMSVPIPPEIRHTQIISAGDLFDAVKSEYREVDCVIMAAAVSDFTPEMPVAHKIKKSNAAHEIKFKPTVDILKWLGENRSSDQILIGFAMETENLETEIVRKREQKHADWIIGNLLNQDGAGFGTDTNHVVVQGRDLRFQSNGTKIDVARDVLIQIFGG
jgi:phosphopantothenoylcysteine decarboxylase / phosphopantothenate---cysteine ligase